MQQDSSRGAEPTHRHPFQAGSSGLPCWLHFGIASLDPTHCNGLSLYPAATADWAHSALIPTSHSLTRLSLKGPTLDGCLKCQVPRPRSDHIITIPAQNSLLAPSDKNTQRHSGAQPVPACLSGLFTHPTCAASCTRSLLLLIHSQVRISPGSSGRWPRPGSLSF